MKKEKDLLVIFFEVYVQQFKAFHSYAAPGQI
jgi:hypothetical protein